MRYIELSQGYRTQVDDDLYQWLNQWKWYYRKRAGKRRGGDVVRTLHGYDKQGHIKNTTLYMASLILPVPPSFVVDHIDCDPLNNQRSNLRRATQRGNVTNSRARVNNKLGIKGVYWHDAKQRYVVQVTVLGKKKWIGDFVELDDAARASKAALEKYHGEFGRFK